MSGSEKLTAALLADCERYATKQSRHNIIPCFSCGSTFVYRGRQADLNGRFCSMRCQDWFDDGNPSYEQQREHERKLINAPLADLIVVRSSWHDRPQVVCRAIRRCSGVPS